MFDDRRFVASDLMFFVIDRAMLMDRRQSLHLSVSNVKGFVREQALRNGMACTTGQLLRHNLWPQKRSSGVQGFQAFGSQYLDEGAETFRLKTNIYTFLSRLSAKTVGQISPFLCCCEQQPTNIYAPHQVTSSADGQGYKPQPAGVFARHEVEHIILSEVTSKITIVLGDCGQSRVKFCCIPAGMLGRGPVHIAKSGTGRLGWSQAFVKETRSKYQSG